MLSVVAIGSPHGVENAGVSLLTLRLCDFLVKSEERQDAEARESQRMKSPIFSEFLKTT